MSGWWRRLSRPIGVMVVAVGVALATTAAITPGRVVIRPSAATDTGGIGFVGAQPAYAIDATGLMPGASRSSEISLRATGRAPVAMSETSATSEPVTPPLGSELQLVITDVTTGRVVYAGAFDGLTTSAPVCAGSLGCAAWAPGETHTLRFTVSLPLAADNSYQGAAASATFVIAAPASSGVAGVATTIPTTGAGEAGWVLLGSLLAVAGAAVMVEDRSRRRAR